MRWRPSPHGVGACLAVLLTARAFLPINPEVWRKALHTIAYTSSLFMMLVSRDWLTSSISCLAFAAIVYPILRAAEGWKGYDRLFTQRHTGEVKVSLLLLFCSHALARLPAACCPHRSRCSLCRAHQPRRQRHGDRACGGRGLPRATGDDLILIPTKQVQTSAARMTGNIIRAAPIYINLS